MGLFESYAPSNANERFLEAVDNISQGVFSIGIAARTAADAYARYVEHYIEDSPKTIINVNMEAHASPGYEKTISNVLNAIKDTIRPQDG